MCWDSKRWRNSFYLKLQSYPPIGALINMEKYSKFQIESLEIQSSRLFCIKRCFKIELL
jgi:hypothetical protein